MVPTTMAHQPNANANLCSTTATPSPATNMLIDSDHPYSVPKKGKQKGATIPSTHTIPSFFQRHPLPPSPTTVATAVGTDHPDTPTTKKRISTTTPTNEKGPANNPIRTPQSHQKPTFRPAGSGLTSPWPPPTLHSTPTRIFFSHCKPFLLQLGKLIHSSHSFPSLRHQNTLH